MSYFLWLVTCRVFSDCYTVLIIHEETLSAHSLLLFLIGLVVIQGFRWWSIRILKFTRVTKVVTGAHEHPHGLMVDTYRVYVFTSGQRIVVILIIRHVLSTLFALNCLLRVEKYRR